MHILNILGCRTYFALRMLLPAAIALIFAGVAQDSSAQSQHSSSLNLGGSEAPIHRKVSLGLNKSIIVELPEDVRDVMVSNPAIVNAVIHSSRRAYIMGNAQGQSNIFFFKDGGKQMVTLEVDVKRDVAPLAELFDYYLPDARIKARMVGENILLSGNVANPSDANRARDIAARFAGDPELILNMIAVGSSEQVMLKVQVAEINRAMVKRLGFNLSASNSNSIAFGVATNHGFEVSNGTGVNSGVAGNIGSDGGACSASSNIIGTVSSPAPWNIANSAISCLSAKIEAFERNGLLRTLAQPNLTAISGETASFLAGGEFPIPAGWRDGVLQVEYKPFGVGLSFTPLVLSGGRISLRVNTEVSEVSSESSVSLGVVTIPGLSVRRANTVVEIPSGGSLVIGGLLSEDVRQSIDKTPGLKKLPILGKLFQSQDYLKSETELVVIITPYLVRAVNKDKLARPDDGFSPEADNKRFLMGRLNRVYGEAMGDLPGTFKNDIGFYVD